MHTGVLTPGKRTRSVLMLLACKGLGGNFHAVLDLACAVEMVHAASLFMDDMPCMDNSRIRPGRPAAHIQFGQDVAMLAAVALLTEALRLVASVSGLSADVRAQLVVVLSQAVGPQGLAKGQFLDLHNESDMRSEHDIAHVNDQKTGVLFAAALDMAALACSASSAARSALQSAALDIGQAFQLRDDLEDGSPMIANSTKDKNKDLGKSTLVSLLGRETVQIRMRRHLATAALQLRIALPDDSQMTLFVLHAFGVQAQSSDVLNANAETRLRSVPASQQMAAR